MEVVHSLAGGDVGVGDPQLPKRESVRDEVSRALRWKGGPRTLTFAPLTVSERILLKV